MPEMFVISYSVVYYIYIPGNPGFCFHNYGAVYDECKLSDTLWFCRSYSFACTLHHFIIIIMQTHLRTLAIWNACQIYFVECVNKIKHILSVSLYTISGAVCFQFPHFPCDDWENIYTLSYYHHQIRSMNHYPLFRVISWNNGVRCMSLYFHWFIVTFPKY